MDVFLIRHAHAGPRTYGSHDKYRPLSDEGYQQAIELTRFFSAIPLAATYSSPATRCFQTIEPVAQAAGLDVVEHNDLWEDAGLDELLAVVDQACNSVVQSMSEPGTAGVNVALCTHGNLIPAVIDRLNHLEVPVSGRGCERASIWRLSRDGDEWLQAQYLTPRSAYQA